MASKSITSTKTAFHRPSLGKANFEASFESGTDESKPGLTRITLPEKSTFTPGAHWHEQYVEYFRVIKGRLIIIRDGVATEAGPEDGPQCIDRFVVHEFMRADFDKPDGEKDPVDVVTEAWTEPTDGQKAVFFRNAFSIRHDSDR